MSIATHILAAMVGGAVAMGGYVIVKVGAEQERRFERQREVERMLREVYAEGSMGANDGKLVAARYAAQIMEVL